MITGIMRNITLAFILLSVTGCATQPVQEQASPQLKAQSQKFLFEAITAFRAGKLSTASQAVETSLKQDPDNGLTYNLRALIRQRLGQFDNATSDFQKAIDLSPNDATIRNNFGTLLCTQKHYSAAEQNFLYAADISTNSEPEIAYTNAGLCSERAGKMNKAQGYFEQAITNYPGQPTALYHLSQLSLNAGDRIQANTYLEQYRQHAPHTAKSLLLAARIEHAMGNLRGVEDYIAQMQTKFPSSPELKQARGLIDPISKQLTPTPNFARAPAADPAPSLVTPIPVSEASTATLATPTIAVPTPLPVPVPAPVSQPAPETIPVAVTQPIETTPAEVQAQPNLNSFVTTQDTTPAAQPTPVPATTAVVAPIAASPFPERTGPVEVKDASWILKQDAGHYTLQILAADNPGRLEELIAQDIAPDTMARFEFSRHDKVWHNLVLGTYAKNSDAQAALNALPEELKALRPWIRPFRSLQRVISQEGYSAFTSR